MSSFKPRKIDSAGLFVNDYRDDRKFFYLDPVVQPTVQILPSGLFKDPSPTVLQALINVAPLDAAIAAIENNGAAGNVAIPVGAVGDVVELRSITLMSAAGGNYAVEDDGVQIAHLVAVAMAATEELLEVPVPVAGGSDITILGGLAPDDWNIRGVRL